MQSQPLVSNRLEQFGGSPRGMARFTGAVYLFYFAAAILSKLLTEWGSVEVGQAILLLSTVLYVTVTLLLFRLLLPVNRGLAVLALLASLLGYANDLLRMARVAPFEIDSLAFYWAFDVLIGLLLWRSGFLPKLLGALMVAAGLGLLVYLFLPADSVWVAFIFPLAFIAEFLLMGWLLVRGLGSDPRQAPV